MPVLTVTAEQLPDFDGSAVTADTHTVILPAGVFDLTRPWHIGAGTGLVIVGAGFVGVWPELETREALITVEDRQSFAAPRIGIQGPKGPEFGFAAVLEVHAREGQSGMNIARCGHVDLEGVAVCKVWGDFFRFDGCGYVRVQSCYGNEAGRHGIAIVKGGQHYAVGNHHVGCHRWGLAMDPNGPDQYVQSLTYAYNYVRASQGLVSGADNVKPGPTVIGANDGPF